MSPLMKAMFEPENLSNASPATVSRAGIIYVSDVELGWLPPVISWLERKPAYLKEILQPLFEKYVDHILTNMRLQYRPLIFNETACTLAAMRTLMDGCLGETEGAPQLDAMRVKRYFVYCLTWSLGGLLDEKDRPAIDADIRSLGGDELPPKEDEESTVFEYTVNSEGTASCLFQRFVLPRSTFFLLCEMGCRLAWSGYASVLLHRSQVRPFTHELCRQLAALVRPCASLGIPQAE